MHDVHFEECLQAAADAVGYEDGPARQGPVRAAQGHADAEPRGDRVERTPVGYVVRSRVVRDGPGRAALAAADGAPSCSAASPGQVEVPDPDTDTLAVRHAHDVEPLDPHDGPRARARRSRDLRANGGERGFGEVRNEGGLDPDTGQGIASTHWHQGAAAAHVTRRRGDRPA